MHYSKIAFSDEDKEKSDFKSEDQEAYSSSNS